MEVRDVTDRRRAEEAIRREDEQLRLLVQASGTLLGSLDLEHVLTQILDLARLHIAADAYAVWRYHESSGEWRTTASAGLSTAYLLAAISSMNHSAAMTATPLIVENLDYEPLLARHREVHRLHGTQALLVVPLRIHNTIAGTLAFYFKQPHHFTDREIHVATALANLAGAAIGTSELYQEQARLRAEAEAAVRVRDQFLALASHDLRNPLTAIKARSQLLRRQVKRSANIDVAHVDAGLAEIEAGVNHTFEVLDDLVAVGQLQSGQTIELRRQQTDLVALTNRVVRGFEAIAERHQIRVEARIPDLMGSWDASRLERALENLLINAIKFSPDGGRILTTLDRYADHDGMWAIIQVQDQGIGIPADDLPFIFEPFRRGRNVTGRVEGAGLGLAGVKHAIRQHGGTIEAASEEGRGSTFTIRLPLPPDAGATEEPARIR